MSTLCCLSVCLCVMNQQDILNGRTLPRKLFYSHILKHANSHFLRVRPNDQSLIFLFVPLYVGLATGLVADMPVNCKENTVYKLGANALMHEL